MEWSILRDGMAATGGLSTQLRVIIRPALNLPFNKWEEILPSPAQAVAICERLIDQATILRFSGKPFRRPRDVYVGSPRRRVALPARSSSLMAPPVISRRWDHRLFEGTTGRPPHRAGWSTPSGRSAVPARQRQCVKAYLSVTYLAAFRGHRGPGMGPPAVRVWGMLSFPARN